MELLDGLNEPQQKAVTHEEGPLLILAGAGSGKTRVITYRLAYLVKERGVSPYNILAVTFTNKAAEEMQERVDNLLGYSTSSLWIGTFHAISVKILRQDIEHLGYDKNFVIYDTREQEILLKNIMARLRIDPTEVHPRAVQREISRAKTLLKTPERYLVKTGSFFQEAVLKVYQEYEKEMKKSRALDFDDLIMKTVQLFVYVPAVLDRYQHRFKHLLVDEYQDVNHAQYRWINLLAGRNGNLCVVGDPDQAIYGFRGADIKNILSFEEDYPQARVVRLEENYRSSANILSSAQELIQWNLGRKEKALRTQRGAGPPVMIREFASEGEEASFVVEESQELIKKRQYQEKDIAIFYRTNAQSRILEDSLMKAAIPYRIVKGLRFYERKEVRDLLAYLKILYNPEDKLSLQRIINTPRRGIGKASWEALLDEAERLGITPYEALSRSQDIDLSSRQRSRLQKFYELIEDLRREIAGNEIDHLAHKVLGKTGLMRELEEEGTDDARSRIENIQELFNVMQEVDGVGMEALEEFLAGVALVAEIDTLDPEKGGLTLMTLHASKGLEFPVVFMVGMEDGFCPHSLSTEPEEKEEERRLCYVGMTRAKDRLYMTWAHSRQIYGNRFSREPSSFLQEFSPETFQEEDPESSEGKVESKEDFPLGSKVLHPTLGIATVISKKGKGDKLTLTLAFPNKGIKDIMVDYVDLEVLN